MGRGYPAKAGEIRVKTIRRALGPRESALVRASLLRARRIILLCDFDGTITGLRREPDAVRLGDGMRRLLEAWRDAGAVVGVVSGRELADVETRVGISGIWYAGGHGYDLRDPRGRVLSFATARDRQRAARTAKRLTKRLQGIAGIRIEAKRSSVAVHYRQASPAAARRAERIVSESLAREPKLRLMHGKCVWELLPARRVDKWTAVERLLRSERAGNSGFVAYFGDDVTDEAVFRGLKRGITVLVGAHRRTAARFRLETIGEVKRFLRWALRERKESLKHSHKGL
jgi:trehalose-phosphatase